MGLKMRFCFVKKLGLDLVTVRLPLLRPKFSPDGIFLGVATAQLSSGPFTYIRITLLPKNLIAFQRKKCAISINISLQKPLHFTNLSGVYVATRARRGLNQTALSLKTGIYWLLLSKRWAKVYFTGISGYLPLCSYVMNRFAHCSCGDRR